MSEVSQVEVSEVAEQGAHTLAYLESQVVDAIKHYLDSMKETNLSDLYAFILESMEEPLLDTVMKHTCGNQVRATEILGISRTTLRKKLAKYFGHRYFKIKE